MSGVVNPPFTLVRNSLHLGHLPSVKVQTVRIPARPSPARHAQTLKGVHLSEGAPLRPPRGYRCYRRRRTRADRLRFGQRNQTRPDPRHRLGPPGHRHTDRYRRSSARARHGCLEGQLLYREPGATVQYSPDGSGAGRKAIIDGSAQFAGSDAYLKDEELASSQDQCGPDGALDIPVYISPIAVAFNLPGITGPEARRRHRCQDLPRRDRQVERPADRGPEPGRQASGPQGHPGEPLR